MSTWIQTTPTHIPTYIPTTTPQYNNHCHGYDSNCSEEDIHPPYVPPKTRRKKYRKTRRNMPITMKYLCNKTKKLSISPRA